MGERGPERIQLRRTKGWRLPEGAVVVSRPSRWGNRYRAMPTAEGWSVFYRVKLGSGHIDVWIERVGIVSRAEAVAESVRLFRKWVEAWAEYEYGDEPDPVGYALEELRGRDLACWCPLMDADGNRVPCHADVLLALANTPAVQVLDEDDGAAL